MDKSPTLFALRAAVAGAEPVTSGVLLQFCVAKQAEEAAAGRPPTPFPMATPAPHPAAPPDRPSKRARRAAPAAAAAASAAERCAAAVAAVTDRLVAAVSTDLWRLNAADIAALQLAMAEAEAIAFVY